MPLRTLPYGALEDLVRAYLDTEEDPVTLRLMAELRSARARGYLTAGELEAVCRWKSARAIHLVRSNGARRVRAQTGLALRARSESQRLAALTALRGVSVPMASALLTLLDPRRYGVLDIRVWQLMHELGAVSANRRGVGLGASHWEQFLAAIRGFASKFGVDARRVERALFRGHREHQRGLLYQFEGRPPARRSRGRSARGKAAAGRSARSAT